MIDQSRSRFTLWALEQLAPDVRPDQDGFFWVDISREDRDGVGGLSRIGIMPSAPAGRDASGMHLGSGISQETVLNWLIRWLQATGHLAEAMPAGQPDGVHQLADRLYAAYRVDSGTAHLAGCMLEDRLIARFTHRPEKTDAKSPQDAIDVYTDHEGHPLTDEIVESLRLGDLNRPDDVGRLGDGELARLVELGLGLIGGAAHGEQFQKAGLHNRMTGDGSPKEPDGWNSSSAASCARLQKVTAIWCKYASGKLRFTIGDVTAEVAFAGWARSLRPPPISCPQTGSATFHLAATEDGRIAAAEEIAACDETGRRLLRRELVRCSVTEKLVVPEVTETCPVSGKRVLRRAMAPCAMCGQHVSPSTLDQGRCAACRGLAPVTLADPRLVRVLDEHPGLDRWRGWRMSETASVYILVANGWIERLLVVVDRRTIEPLCIAHGTRLRNDWELVASERWSDLLE